MDGSPRSERSHAGHDRGFTLVEILIAIVLVGVLSAVVVVGVGSLTSKGSAASCSASADALRAGAAVHLATQGAYPASIDAMVSAGSVSLAPGVTVSGRAATSTGWQVVMAGSPPVFVCGTTTLDVGVTIGLFSQDRALFVRNNGGTAAVDASASTAASARWRIAAGVAGQGISFESTETAGSYLRHSSSRIWIHQVSPATPPGTPQFDVSFHLRPGLNGTGLSFESTNYPNQYLEARSDGSMWITPLVTGDTAMRNRMSWAAVPI